MNLIIHVKSINQENKNKIKNSIMNNYSNFNSGGNPFEKNNCIVELNFRSKGRHK